MKHTSPRLSTVVCSYLLALLASVLSACGADDAYWADSGAQSKETLVLSVKDGELPNYLVVQNLAVNNESKQASSTALSLADEKLWTLNSEAANVEVKQTGFYFQKVIDASRQIRAVADFNGDGKADLLWQTSSGFTTVNLMDGTTVLACYALGTYREKILGTGDFDGDHQADIVWRNMKTGAVRIFYMDRGLVANMNDISQNPIALETKLEAIGDFDGNGRADMLWRNQSTGRSVISYHHPYGNVTSWPVVSNFINPATTVAMKVGDINGDGKDDIVWRNLSSGKVLLSLMDGNVPTWHEVTSTSLPLNVALEAIGDFDANGKADLLWRNTSTGRSLISHHRADGSVNNWGVLSQFINPANTQVRGTGDFDGDGADDVLWINTTTGNSLLGKMSNGLPNWRSVALADCHAQSWELLAGAYAKGHFDGTGANARFNQIGGIAADAAGNVYVADTANHVIRKITPNGTTTTLAGAPGECGHRDGMGSDVRLCNPNKLTIDGQGHLYFSMGFSVKKLCLSGEVSTLAGNPLVGGDLDGEGVDARIGGVNGITADGSGNVYVATSLPEKIRKISPTGSVITLAGGAPSVRESDGQGGAASFSILRSIAADANGNIYVGGNGTLRKVTPTGWVSTLAGVEGYYGISKSRDGVGSAARFKLLSALTTDPAGNIYVADGPSLRRVTPQGAVSTVVGLISPAYVNEGTYPTQMFGPFALTYAGNRLYLGHDYAVLSLMFAEVWSQTNENSNSYP